MRFNRFYLIENRALSLAENPSKQTRNLELCFEPTEKQCCETKTQLAVRGSAFDRINTFLSHLFTVVSIYSLSIFDIILLSIFEIVQKVHDYDIVSRLYVDEQFNFLSMLNLKIGIIWVMFRYGFKYWYKLKISRGLCCRCKY